MIEEESTTKWKQFSSGDNAAYCWLYNEYVQLLIRYGFRFTSDIELIKDCIHDIFTTLYENKNHLGTAPANVKVYLLVSLKNNLTRALNKKNKYNYVGLGMALFILEPTIEERLSDIESDKNRQNLIEKILLALPQRQKEIIYYRYIQEFDFNKICVLMQLNYQSSQNLLQRAFKKIRELFPFETFYE